ncbi:MAG TPA: alpha/beta hydrolase domain-containing protein [Terriglobia bacterium]|nr:alpha/beta hydrolase domain-containing protein [Terriglobia bacterium]
MICPKTKHWAVPLALITIVLSVTAAAAAQSAPGAIPIPKVTGPIPVTADSFPFAAANRSTPVVDLAKIGYVEEEFIVTGTANVYDWAADGTVTVKTPSAPYGNRILVRRPADPARFSGTVIFEPLFAARRFDWPMMWGYSHDYIVESGAAWVGVTLPVSVDGLKKFNATRYAQLSFANPTSAPCAGAQNNAPSPTEEGLRLDMFSQVAALLKSGTLPGLRAQYVFAAAQGGDLPIYINAIHSRATLASGKPAFDGYLMRPGVTPARINQCAAAPGANDPRRMIKGINVPVVIAAAQGEALTTLPWRRTDSDAPNDIFRLYELAGVGHIDWWAYYGFPKMEDQVTAVGSAQGPAAWPFAARCEPEIPLMPLPVLTQVYNATFSNLDQFVRKGTPLPKAARLELKGEGTPQQSFALDQFGHGVGGIRTVYMDVPAANYFVTSPGPGTCREMGHIDPFSWSRLESLYGNYKNYSTKVEQTVDRLVKERWLTEADARRAKAELLATAPAVRSNNN